MTLQDAFSGIDTKSQEYLKNLGIEALVLKAKNLRFAIIFIDNDSYFSKIINAKEDIIKDIKSIGNYLYITIGFESPLFIEQAKKTFY